MKIKQEILKNKFIDFSKKYAKIGKSNHYIVLILVFLIFNYIITRTGANISFYIIPIIIGFFLNLIFSNSETYTIEVTNNGERLIYTDVKYKFNEKKNRLIIFERNGKKTNIIQGNYTIIPFENKEEKVNL